MLSREDKMKVVDSIRADIERADALFVTNMIGIASNDAVAIRKKIRQRRGKVVVVKNTLLGRASEGTGAEKLFKGLKGPHAVAFAFGDAPAVAKCLKEAGGDFELVRLEGGFLDGQLLTAPQVRALADLPSKEQMLGTLLATMMAPVSAFVRVLNAIREKREGAEKTSEGE